MEDNIFQGFRNINGECYGCALLQNPDFQKKKDSHKNFREILLHELVQPLLDKRTEGDMLCQGPVEILSATKYGWKEHVFLHELKSEMLYCFWVQKESQWKI